MRNGKTAVDPTVAGIDVLRQVVAGQLPLPPAAALLGWEALELRPAYARVRYTARPEFYNPAGCVQGGFLAAMLDDAMGPAAFTILPAGQFTPTLEMKVTFVRPAYAGTLIGEGRILHSSRRVIFLEGTLRTENGDVVATATATALVAARELPEDNPWTPVAR